MTELTDDLVENLKEPSHWIRIFFMFVFYIVLGVVAMILLVLTLGQALFSLITGKSNDELRVLGGSLAQYTYQIWQFLTYNTESKPFPFDTFPGMEFVNSSPENPGEPRGETKESDVEEDEEPVKKKATRTRKKSSKKVED